MKNQMLDEFDYIDKPQNPFLNIIRWMLFIPISIALLSLIQIGVFALFNWVINWDINIIFQIILVLFFGGIIWGVFKTISFMLALVVLKICPNVKAGANVFSLFIMLIFLGGVFYLWYDNWGHFILICLILTSMNFGIMAALGKAVEMSFKRLDEF